MAAAPWVAEPEIVLRRLGEGEQGEGASAQRERDDGRDAQRFGQLVGAALGDLGADELIDRKLVGQALLAGHAAQAAPFEVDDVQRGGPPGAPARGVDEAVGQSREQGLLEQIHGIVGPPPARGKRP